MTKHDWERLPDQRPAHPGVRTNLEAFDALLAWRCKRCGLEIGGLPDPEYKAGHEDCDVSVVKQIQDS